MPPVNTSDRAGDGYPILRVFPLTYQKVEAEALPAALVLTEDTVDSWGSVPVDRVIMQSLLRSPQEVLKLETNFPVIFKVMGAVVHHLTGCDLTPRQGDVRKLLFDMRRLAQLHKYSNLLHSVFSPQSVFCVMPYLLAGFDIRGAGSNQEGKNSTESLLAFIQALTGSAEINSESLLCAHRDSDVSTRDRLRESIDLPGLIRAVHLISGVFCNMPGIRSAQHTFRQPFGTARGLTAVFPTILKTYASAGETAGLARKLNEHAQSLSIFLSKAEASTSPLRFRVIGVDPLLRSAIAEVPLHFGPRWNAISRDDLHSPALSGTLVEICRDYTDPKTRRLEESMALAVAALRRGQDLVERHHPFYYVLQELTIQGKAALETMFYYTWGKRLGAAGSAAVGLDRDHHRYQTLSFAYGYHCGQGGDPASWRPNDVPLLYARHVKPEYPPQGVEDLSFRQFWSELDRS